MLAVGIGCEIGWPRTEIWLGRRLFWAESDLVEARDSGEALNLRVLVCEEARVGTSSAGVGASGWISVIAAG